MASLADLVAKKRKSGGSITGSLSYGFRERMKETMDPRRMLNQNGLMTALFPKLKAYTAGEERTVKSSGLSKVSKIAESIISPSDSILDSINVNTQITAKNSMVLPAMHRDINVMRQNIVKLVKIKGGNATNKADMWFMKASTAEAAYETRTGKTNARKIKDTKPTPEKEKEDKGFFDGIFSMIKNLPVITALTKGLSALGSAVATIGTSIVGIVGVVGMVGGLFVRMLKVFAKSPLAWVVAAIGAGYLMDNWKDIQKSYGDLAGAIDTAKNIGGQTTTEAPQTPTTPTDAGQPTANKKTESLGASAGTTMKDLGVSQTVGNRAIAGAGAYGAYRTYKSYGAAKKLATTTAEKILDVRTMSAAQLANSTPKSVWGKFLAFVAKKSPKLWGKLAVKLMQMGTLATIPVVGWIGALINFGFTVWTAWELYELWKEFNNIEDNPTSPTQVTSPEMEAFGAGTPGAEPTPEQKTTNKNAMDPALTRDQVTINQNREKLKQVDEYVKNSFGKETVDGLPGSRKLTREELRSKATKLFGYDRDLGTKLNNANAQVAEQKRQTLKPVVTVNKSTNNKTVPSSPVGSSSNDVSVYDIEFMNLMGFSGTSLRGLV